MVISMVDIESYKNLLLFAQQVNISGFDIKQFTVRELLTEYSVFNTKRQFVYIDKDTFSSKDKTDIDSYMFDVKEMLAISYSDVGYDLEYDKFDMVCYIGFVNAMFIDFLNYFTNHKIISVSHMPEFDRMNISYDDTKILGITREDFNIMMNMFCVLNYATEINDDVKVRKTKNAEEFDDKKKELESKFGFVDKPTITFNSILSWLVNDGYTHEILINKTIYQVMDSFKRKNHMEYCKMINTARSNGLCNMTDNELNKVNNAFCLY